MKKACTRRASHNRPSKARRKLLGLRHIFPSLRYGKTSFMASPLLAIGNGTSLAERPRRKKKKEEFLWVISKATSTRTKLYGIALSMNTSFPLIYRRYIREGRKYSYRETPTFVMLGSRNYL